MSQFQQFIIQHWPLWGALLVLLLLTITNEFLSLKKKAKELSPQAAVDLINNSAVVVDLRDKESFKKGHIIDSINATAEDFNHNKMNKYKEKNIILVCARGVQATGVASKAKTLGFQTMVLSGGIAAWQNADLPLVKSKG